MNVTHQGESRHYRTVWFDKARNRVRLIEQRLLPHKFKVVSTADYRETARAITDMIVRGAGAIGAAAAYGLAQGARAFRRGGLKAFERHLAKVHRTLAEARPTAVDPLNGSVLGYDAFFPGTNFHDIDQVENQNGVVFFPGSAPIYIDGQLVGGLGVSGDGVDQDDVVTAAGIAGFAPPAGVARADQVAVDGVRLPYIKFRRNPEG